MTVWHLDYLEIQIWEVVIDWSDFMVKAGYSGVFWDRWERLVSVVFQLNCMSSRSIQAIRVIVEVFWLLRAGLMPMALSATVHAASFRLSFFFFGSGKFLKLFISWGVVSGWEVGQSNIWAVWIIGVGSSDVGSSLSGGGSFLGGINLPLSPNLVKFSSQLDKACKGVWRGVNGHDLIMEGRWEVLLEGEHLCFFIRSGS